MALLISTHQSPQSRALAQVIANHTPKPGNVVPGRHTDAGGYFRALQLTNLLVIGWPGKEVKELSGQPGRIFREYVEADGSRYISAGQEIYSRFYG